MFPDLEKSVFRRRVFIPSFYPVYSVQHGPYTAWILYIVTLTRRTKEWYNYNYNITYRYNGTRANDRKHNARKEQKNRTRISWLRDNGRAIQIIAFYRTCFFFLLTKTTGANYPFGLNVARAEFCEEQTDQQWVVSSSSRKQLSQKCVPCVEQ